MRVPPASGTGSYRPGQEGSAEHPEAGGPPEVSLGSRAVLGYFLAFRGKGEA